MMDFAFPGQIQTFLEMIRYASYQVPYRHRHPFNCRRGLINRRSRELLWQLANSASVYTPLFINTAGDDLARSADAKKVRYYFRRRLSRSGRSRCWLVTSGGNFQTCCGATGHKRMAENSKSKESVVNLTSLHVASKWTNIVSLMLLHVLLRSLRSSMSGQS